MTIRAVARAHLRYQILAMLHEGMALAKVDYAFIAAYTGTPERKVRSHFEGNGDLTADDLAKYLHAMGLEVRVTLVGWRVDEAAEAATDQPEMGAEPEPAAVPTAIGAGTDETGADQTTSTEESR